MDEYAERNSVDYDSTFFGPKIDSHLPSMIDSGKIGSGLLPSEASLGSSIGSRESTLLSSSSSQASSKEATWFRNPFKKRQKPNKQTHRQAFACQRGIHTLISCINLPTNTIDFRLLQAGLRTYNKNFVLFEFVS